MITAACNNFTGLGITRFLLGCFEGTLTMRSTALYLCSPASPNYTMLHDDCGDVVSTPGTALPGWDFLLLQWRRLNGELLPTLPLAEIADLRSAWWPHHICHWPNKYLPSLASCLSDLWGCDHYLGSNIDALPAQQYPICKAIHSRREDLTRGKRKAKPNSKHQPSSSFPTKPGLIS
jgi:hypothetical protein